MNSKDLLRCTKHSYSNTQSVTHKAWTHTPNGGTSQTHTNKETHRRKLALVKHDELDAKHIPFILLIPISPPQSQ